MNATSSPAVVVTRPLTDQQLLAMWEGQAKAGVPCAVVRVALLRAKIERQAEERV